MKRTIFPLLLLVVIAIGGSQLPSVTAQIWHDCQLTASRAHTSVSEFRGS